MTPDRSQFSVSVVPWVRDIARLLRARRQWLAVAESCTGGLIAKTLTDLHGSSDWFDRGLVTYSNGAKHDLLGIPPDLILRHGAVSEVTAKAMAVGLLARSPAHWSIGVTGIAGPGGGSPDKPVGLVWIAWGFKSSQTGGETTEEVWAREFRFGGDRDAVRAQAAAGALEGLLERLRHV